MSSSIPLGSSIPADPHAVSVSLPAWKDNVDYEEGALRVTNVMETGYPRFFVHRAIQQLARLCLDRLGASDESCYLFPSIATARHCRAFLLSAEPSIHSRIVEFPVGRPLSAVQPPSNDDNANDSSSSSQPYISVYAIFLPTLYISYGKQFWQHTGAGISSRLAEKCLFYLEQQPQDSSPPESNNLTSSQRSQRSISRNRHYARSPSSPVATTHPPLSPSSITPTLSSSSSATPPQTTAAAKSVFGNPADIDLYLEERYGRNLSQTLAPLAKSALKKRIAGVLRGQEEEEPQQSTGNADLSEANAKTLRGIDSVNENNVYLYPSGMNAIWNAHQLALAHRKAAGGNPGKSICFGFPYTDTLKCLEKWGPGCIHLGNGLDSDIDTLENEILPKLAEGQDNGGVEGPILALHCEFPSNPLLRSPNLSRLRGLADRYGFLLILDETIGTFVNVEILPLVDIVVSSLTKIFSGDCNVMSGSLVLNPNSKHYESLKKMQDSLYEDNLFNDDAIYLERNSRDFRPRIQKINHTTEKLCDHLVQHYSTQSISSDNDETKDNSSRVIKQIYYTKYITPSNYEAHCRRYTVNDNDAGYGGLFSITFHTDRISPQRFYDALSCAKGPSLGTNFTLASPYTILAHYAELDWAKSWGVDENLVRVSIGLEDADKLVNDFDNAIKAAIL